MSEIVPTYQLTNPDEVIPMERADFYDEQIKIFKETGNSTHAVEVVNILLFNHDGEVMLQKRSSKKRHNPNLLDKSIGGHMRFGEDRNFEVQVEMIQELAVPAIIMEKIEDFEKTYSLLKDYTSNTALVQHVDTNIKKSIKIIDDEEVQIANKFNFYIGVYSGSIKPADKEASGVLFYKLDDLRDEIKNMPQLFTHDLQFFLKEYKERIDAFLEYIR